MTEASRVVGGIPGAGSRKITNPSQRVEFIIGAVNEAAPGIAAVSAGFANLTAIGMRTMAELNASMGAMEAGAMAAGAGAALALGYATYEAAQFEKQMKQVQAVSDSMSKADYSNMSNQIKAMSVKYGEDPGSTAEAMQTIGRAGIKDSAAQMSLFESALKMAKIEGMDLKDAVDGIIKSTSMFGAEMDNPKEFAKYAEFITEKLTQASQLSPTDVPDILMGTKYVGGTAKEAGWSPEETFGDIAYMASKGVPGETAGTALRGLLQKGSMEQTNFIKAAQSVGLDSKFMWTTDATGKEVMKPLADIVEQVNAAADAKWGKQDTQERLKLWTGIGMQKTSQQILKIKPEELRRFNEEMQQQFDLDSKVAIVMESLSAQVDRLISAFKVLAINVGEYSLPIVKLLVAALEGLANFVGTNPFAPFLIFLTLAGAMVLGLGIAFNWLMIGIKSAASGFMRMRNAGMSLGQMFKYNTQTANEVSASQGRVKTNTDLTTVSVIRLAEAFNALAIAQQRAAASGFVGGGAGGGWRDRPGSMTVIGAGSKQEKIPIPTGKDLVNSNMEKSLQNQASQGAIITNANIQKAINAKTNPSLFSRISQSSTLGMLGGPAGIGLMGGLIGLTALYGYLSEEKPGEDEQIEKVTKQMEGLSNTKEKYQGLLNEEQNKLKSLNPKQQEYWTTLAKVADYQNKVNDATDAYNGLSSSYATHLRTVEQVTERVSNNQAQILIDTKAYNEYVKNLSPPDIEGPIGKTRKPPTYKPPESEINPLNPFDYAFSMFGGASQSGADALRVAKDRVMNENSVLMQNLRDDPAAANRRLELVNKKYGYRDAKWGTYDSQTGKFTQSSDWDWAKNSLLEYTTGAELALFDWTHSVPTGFENKAESPISNLVKQIFGGKDTVGSPYVKPPEPPTKDGTDNIVSRFMKSIFGGGKDDGEKSGGGPKVSAFGIGWIEQLAKNKDINKAEKNVNGLTKIIEGINPALASIIPQSQQTGSQLNTTFTNTNSGANTYLTPIPGMFGLIPQGIIDAYNNSVGPVNAFITLLGQIWAAVNGGVASTVGAAAGFTATAVSKAAQDFNTKNVTIPGTTPANIGGAVVQPGKQVTINPETGTIDTKSPVKIWKGGPSKKLSGFGDTITFPELDPDLFKKRAIETGQAFGSNNSGLTIGAIHITANTKHDAKVIRTELRKELNKIAKMVS